MFVPTNKSMFIEGCIYCGEVFHDGDAVMVKTKQGKEVLALIVRGMLKCAGRSGLIEPRSKTITRENVVEICLWKNAKQVEPNPNNDITDICQGVLYGH